MTLTPGAKLLAIAALFVVTLALVAVADAAGSPVPLFVMWVPLIAVPWVMTRPDRPAPTAEPREPGAGGEPQPAGGSGPSAGSAPGGRDEGGAAATS